MIEGWEDASGEYHPGIEARVTGGQDEAKAITETRDDLLKFLEPEIGPRMGTASKKTKPSGNVQRTDKGLDILGEEAGPVQTAKVREATPDTRVRDREGALVEYESTKPYDEGTKIAQQLPPGRAEGAGPVDMEGLSPEDSVSRSHISSEELTMDSPKAQEAMLDLFGDEHEFMMQRVRDILRQMPPEVKQTLPQQMAAGRGAPTNLRAIIKEVADAKTVDELAGTIHGRGFRGVDEGPGDVPVSIDNLRATIASAPDSPEKTAALEKLNRFSAEVSRKSVGRQTKQVPTVHPNRPKPDPRLLEELIDRLNKPINPQDKAETRLGELRNLYRTARGDFPPKDPSKVVRRNTDPSGRLKAIQSAGENVAPDLSQSMIDMLQELLGQ